MPAFWTKCCTDFLWTAKNYQMRNVPDRVYEHNNCPMYPTLEPKERNINSHCTIMEVIINLYSTAASNNDCIEISAAKGHGYDAVDRGSKPKFEKIISGTLTVTLTSSTRCKSNWRQQKWSHALVRHTPSRIPTGIFSLACTVGQKNNGHEDFAYPFLWRLSD